MSIDWDKFREDARKAARQSGAETNAELANEISSATRLTDAQVQEICPTPADKAKLAELLALVKSATDHNTKIAALERKAGEYAGIIVKLLDRLA